MEDKKEPATIKANSSTRGLFSLLLTPLGASTTIAELKTHHKEPVARMLWGCAISGGPFSQVAIVCGFSNQDGALDRMVQPTSVEFCSSFKT